MQVRDLESAAADAEPAVLVEARNNPLRPDIPPDGNWLVYGSAGGGGLYVQPYCAGPGPRRQIAPEGIMPVWRGDGKEILYRRGDAMMAVSMEWSAGQPSVGTPRELFQGVRAADGQSSLIRPLAVSRDGTRIFYAQGEVQPDANVIHIKKRRLRRAALTPSSSSRRNIDPDREKPSAPPL